MTALSQAQGLITVRLHTSAQYDGEFNDWYNLVASWRRKWSSAVWYIEKFTSGEGVRTIVQQEN